MYSTILRERSRTLPNLLEGSGICSHLLLLARHMGGRRSLYPIGVNRWKSKRLKDKKALDKDKRLDQEKQPYQTRVRSVTRSGVAGKPNSSSVSDSATTRGPKSAAVQVTASVDRFAKPGAVDLWNEDDGPLKSPRTRSNEQTEPAESSRENRPNRSPSGLRNLVFKELNLGDCVDLSSAGNGSRYVKSRSYLVQSGSIGSNFVKSRSYSVQSGKQSRRKDSSSSKEKAGIGSKTKNSSERKGRRNDSSSSKEKSGISSKSKKSSNEFRKKIWKTGNCSSDESDDDFVNDSVLKLSGEDEKDSRRRGDMKKKGSSASLENHDIKTKKRVPLNCLQSEIDSLREINHSRVIDLIKHEVSLRKLAKIEGEKSEELVLTDKKYDEYGISSLTVKALSDAGFVQMTKLQEATLATVLRGNDTLIKAKTGSRKSAAFLIPAVEAVLKAMSCKINQRGPSIYALVLCPTIELAKQIAAEAKILLKYHDGIGVQTLVGGTRLKDDGKLLDSDPCQIIIATPGRLLDHIESKSAVSAHLRGLKLFIVDEADYLLDLGFRKDVERIADRLPRERQSLMFSAAIPKEVRRMAHVILKKEHAYVDGTSEVPVETHTKVKQSFLIAPHDQHFQIVYHLLKEHISKVFDYKVIVFCSTTMVTSFMHLLLRGMGMNVREMHSRKTQLQTRISDEFREADQMILVTSNVSAHEIDCHDVTLVIQMGIPLEKEELVERLGRIGHEGEGEGVLLLAPWEEYFLDEIKDLSLKGLSLPFIDPNITEKTKFSMAMIDTSIKEAVYHDWLRYYNSVEKIGRDKATLDELAIQFCESIGLQTPPTLFKFKKTSPKKALGDIPEIIFSE